MANELAPPGTMFVCQACGKRAKDKYGFDPIDSGYDESCMLNSVLVQINMNGLKNYTVVDNRG